MRSATVRATRSAPKRVGADADWVAVAAGYAHGIALKKDGSLWAWGWNSSGQLGDGTTTDRATPVPVGADKNWVAVCCGNFHSTAMRSDGSVWAWGGNNYGQLGDGTNAYRVAPKQVFVEPHFTRRHRRRRTVARAG